MEAVGNFELTDEQIIYDYCQTGSRRASNAFMRRYKNFVFATALRYMNSYDDSEDITQEVFIKALQSLHKFKGDSSLKTWLYRITVNTCINAKRKRSIFSVFSRVDLKDYEELGEDLNTPDRVLQDAEFEQRFLKVLSKLPEKQRETFALRYFDDLSYEEISNILGTSVGGLKANYFQATKKISEILKKEMKDE